MTALLILAGLVLLLLAVERPGRAATVDELAQARREALGRQEVYVAQRRE